MPRNGARTTKLWGAQRSTKLAFRSADFVLPENLLFPALVNIGCNYVVLKQWIYSTAQYFSGLSYPEKIAEIETAFQREFLGD